MNFIDHYNSTASKFQIQTTQKQGFLRLLDLRVKQSELRLPHYLIFMRNKFQKQFPHTSVSIFSNCIYSEQPQQEELILSILHHKTRNRQFQYYNEVIINQKYQSITIKGSLLLNNQFIKIRSHEQIIMAIRKANNLNPEISPLRVNVNPIEGTVELLNCSYVDSKFSMLSNSQKNIEYFTFRVSFIINMILEEMSILFYIIQEEQLAHLYNGKFKHSIQTGAKILASLQNSLYRLSFGSHYSSEAAPSYHQKRAQMEKHHQKLEKQVSNILAVYSCDADRVQYLKPSQIHKLSNQYQDVQFISQFATQLEHLIKFSIYSKIHFSNDQVIWQELGEHGGNCKIDCALVRFLLVTQDYSNQQTISRKRNGQTEQSCTSYSIKQYQRRSFIQTKVTRKTLSKVKFNKGKNEKEKIEREKTVLRKLRDKSHPNIMTFFESDSPQYKDYIYTLFEENQSLEIFTQKNANLSFFQKIFMLQQAAKGMLFLHKNNIIHLDFKPANLIVGRKFLVKICDFGQSCIQNQFPKHHKFGSTYPFAPPEYYSAFKDINCRFDVYSLGVTIYKCLFSEHIWGVMSSKTNFLKQLKIDGPKLLLLPQKFRDFSCNKIVKIIVFLCLRCISQVPQIRPTMAWIVTVLEYSRKYLEYMHYK